MSSRLRSNLLTGVLAAAARAKQQAACFSLIKAWCV
jgi:hypothetical protein